MAFTTLILEDKNKVIKKAPIGYSWTTLFFWFFVPLIRGAYLHTIVILLIGAITSLIAWLIIFPFLYNKIYLESLIKKGFKPKKYVEIYFGKNRLSKKEELSLIRKKAGINIKNLPAIPIDSDEVDKIQKIKQKIKLLSHHHHLKVKRNGQNQKEKKPKLKKYS